MNNKNKIILIGHNYDKNIEIMALLTSKNENIKIAKTFTTNIDYKDLPIKEWKYYMDNDDLFLSYKNNALLCISTNKEQISEGVTKEEAYNSQIIPMTYSMFNIASPKYIKDMTICWIDSSFHRTKNIVKETMEMMKTYKKYPVIYFTDEDSSESISNIIIRYLNSDESERQNIIDECN